MDHELVVGEVVLRELRRKLKSKLKLPTTTIDEIDGFLRESLVVQRPAERLSLGISDADDEWSVASAVAGGAHVLVTGDAAVLEAAARARRVPDPRSARGDSDATRWNR